MARRWVRSLHRLGSSLDLKDTVRWKQKTRRAHTWTTSPGEEQRAGGQSAGALGRPWTPLRKPPGGRGGAAPAEASCSWVHLSGPFWAPPALARGVGPATRKKPLETPTGFRAERARGTSSARAIDSASPGCGPTRGEAGAVADRAGGAAESAVFTSPREGWGPESRSSLVPGQEAERARSLSLCLSEDPCSLEPEAPFARLGLPKAFSGSHLP